MKTVIIDDEVKSRQTIINFISKYAPELEVVGEADGVESAINLIETIKPELVFLDIQMPDGTGFELLGRLNYNNFKLIFCTSFDQFAIKAFRYSALDYILKPIDPDIFRAAVKKIFSEKEHNSLKDKINVLDNNKTGFTRMALHSAEGINLVKIKDVIRCESSVNYTKFIINKASSLLVTKTLKEYDELLSTHGFIRIHKSHLVNINFVKKYIKGDGGWVEMYDGSKIEVSRRKKETLMEILGNL